MLADLAVHELGPDAAIPSERELMTTYDVSRATVSWPRSPKRPAGWSSGTLVMCTGFRNAALLAKMAATLDHVSGGRLILGIGAGWHEPEYEAFGYPYDHRVGRFEEALTVITDLIRHGRADLAGTYVTARDALLLPPARPDLPILVASKGPRMQDLTARHADAWNARLVRPARRATRGSPGGPRRGL